MKIEIFNEEEVVFGMYPDGNVLIKDDSEIISKNIELCKEASDYLSKWLSTKQIAEAIRKDSLRRYE